MITLFMPLRGFSIAALCVRMVLAFICGGLVGIEREYKRRPAGFRTHILICMGAAMTTLTSQYLYLEMNYQTDMARLGAQVIAGIGFIGAGTIIVTATAPWRGLRRSHLSAWKDICVWSKAEKRMKVRSCLRFLLCREAGDSFYSPIAETAPDAESALIDFRVT